MNYVIVDLEATCWEKGSSPKRMEIIEIGAVKMDGSTFEKLSEFSSFVKPVQEPILSDFCTELTSITQKDVDSVPVFPEVFKDFLKWIGYEPYYLCSWGEYDLKQFKIDCERNSILLPNGFKNHLNIKKKFCELHGIRSCGMKRALQILEIPMEGTHHRGIDDARNIAKIFRWILQRNEI